MAGKMMVMKNVFIIFAALFWFTATVSVAFADTKTNAAPAKASHVNGKEAGKLVAKGTVTVLDIRTASEFEDSHIAGATNIDYTDNKFEAEIAKLDRNKTYLVHCASGNRSTKSLPKFEKLGFKNIIHLDGGIKAWEAAGNPVKK